MFWTPSIIFMFFVFCFLLLCFKYVCLSKAISFDFVILVYFVLVCLSSQTYVMVYFRLIMIFCNILVALNRN
uniref:Uncharacterized protein n=1 Tax=Cannabis sativa TaxID=3483 RepID=A0A803R709_CANSA